MKEKSRDRKRYIQWENKVLQVLIKKWKGKLWKEIYGTWGIPYIPNRKAWKSNQNHHLNERIRDPRALTLGTSS